MPAVYREICQDEQASLHCLKIMREQGDAQAETKLDQQIANDPTSAYRLAQLYAEEAETDNDWERVYGLYAMAALQGHDRANQTLHQWAEQGDRIAQYYYGRYYAAHYQDWPTVVNWCRRSEQQGYEPAQSYLHPSSFTAEACLAIARCFYRESPEDLKTEYEQALVFYDKAMRYNQAQAGLEAGNTCLAQLDDGLDDWLDRACRYWLRSAHAGQDQALQLLNYWGLQASANIQRQVGDYYRQQTGVQHQQQARWWYNRAYDHGDTMAGQRLQLVNQSDRRGNTFFRLAANQSNLSSSQPSEQNDNSGSRPTFS